MSGVICPIYEFLSVWAVVEDRSFIHSMLWMSCVTGFFKAWYIWGGTVSLGFDILFFIWVRKIWYWYTECLFQGSDIFSAPWWGTFTLVPPPQLYACYAVRVCFSLLKCFTLSIGLCDRWLDEVNTKWQGSEQLGTIFSDRQWYTCLIVVQLYSFLCMWTLVKNITGLDCATCSWFFVALHVMYRVTLVLLDGLW